MALSSLCAPLLIAASFCPQEGMEEQRDRVSKRLEEIRGLRFTKSLSVRRGTRKEYARYALRNTQAIYGADLDAAERFLKACGLIPPRMRLKIAITARAPVGVSAYYDTGELLFVKQPVADDILLSKIATGLLDQHFPVAERRKKAGTNFDAQIALSAVRSGDADIAKNMMWHGKKGDGPISQDFLRDLVHKTEKWEKKESRFQSMIVPRLFVRSGGFGYRRGSVFVETLRLRGGWKLVNHAQQTAPVSTEQILHPEKYLLAELPVKIDLSPVIRFLQKEGYGLVYQTTLGEFGTSVLLETHLPKSDLSSVGPGWGGDTIALFAKGKKEILVWATEWDTVGDAEEFHQSMVRVSKKLGTRDTGGKSVLVRKGTSCAWLARFPASIQERLLAALWTCTRSKKERYGKE